MLMFEERVRAHNITVGEQLGQRTYIYIHSDINSHMLHNTYIHTYIYAYFISRNTLSLFISASIATIEMKLRSLETEHENIANISSVREMLINIFGTRGIQNYVFLGLLKQIEFIANRYLEVT